MPVGLVYRLGSHPSAFSGAGSGPGSGRQRHVWNRNRGTKRNSAALPV